MRIPGLLLGALVLMAPMRAAASSVNCSWPPVVDMPEDGAQDVPTNARFWHSRQSFLWVGEGEPPELVLLGPAGMEPEVIESRVDLFESQELVVLTPREPLLPETRYQLWECQGPLCTRLLKEITTGTGPDTSEPMLPVEVDREHGRNSVSLTLDFESILVVSLGDVALDPSMLTGSAHAVTVEGDETIPFAEANRYCSDTWPGSIRDEQTLRYGAFDLAGNFSGWSEPEPLSIAGCGCSANRSKAPWLALLVLLGACLRRRRGPPGR